MHRPPPLLLVTDRARVASLPRAVEAALAAIPVGAAWVQLREKELPVRELAALARSLLPLCRARGAKLLVNDRLDVALAAGADGVHLAEGSVEVEEARALLGPDAIVTAAVHDEAGVRRRAGVELLVAAPFGAVPGKGAALGIAGIVSLLRVATGPLCALGGVTAAEVPALRRAGVAGIGAIRGWAGEDGGAGAAALYAAWMGGGT